MKPRNWFRAAYRCRDCDSRFLATTRPLLRATALLGAFCAGISPLVLAFLLIPLDAFTEATEPGDETRGPAVRQSADSSRQSHPADPDTGSGGARLAGFNAQYREAMALLEEFRASDDRLALENHLRLVRHAASGGDAQAQAELGDIYVEGRGVVQDFVAAANWYRSAAEQGVARAMYELGRMAQQGWGMDENLIEAYVWFNLAAARGQPNAPESRNHLVALLTVDELSEAQQRSREADRQVPLNPRG